MGGDFAARTAAPRRTLYNAWDDILNYFHLYRPSTIYSADILEGFMRGLERPQSCHVRYLVQNVDESQIYEQSASLQHTGLSRPQDDCTVLALNIAALNARTATFTRAKYHLHIALRWSLWSTTIEPIEQKIWAILALIVRHQEPFVLSKSSPYICKWDSLWTSAQTRITSPSQVALLCSLCWRKLLTIASPQYNLRYDVKHGVDSPWYLYLSYTHSGLYHSWILTYHHVS